MNLYTMVFLSAWLPHKWASNGDDFFLAYSSCYNMAPDCPHVADLRNVTLGDCMALTNKRSGTAFAYNTEQGCSILECPLDSKRYYKQFTMVEASGMNIWLKRHATKYIELQPERPQSEIGISDYTNEALDLLSGVLEMVIHKPLIGQLLGTMIKTIINIFTGDSYNSIRAQVMWDITEKIEENDINKMKIKLDVIYEIIQRIQDIVGTTVTDLHDWMTSNSSIETVYNQSALLEEVRILETILDTSRDDFVLLENQYKSLPFYKDYALAHIFTLAILEKAGDQSLKYKQRIESAAQEHLQYMMAGIGQLHHLKTQNLIKLYKSSCLKFKDNKANSEAFGVNRLMDCSLKELFHSFSVNSLETFLEKTSINDTILKSGDRVALKYGEVKEQLWFDCGGSGSNCRLTKIDKQDQPFASTGSCNRIEFKNRGLLFWIHALERSKNEAVKTCDKVSLFYSTEVSKYYYVSGKYKDKCIPIPHCAIQTKTCPGDAFQSGNITKVQAEIDDCPKEQFEIHVPGYACGAEIRDRTAVVLRSSSSNHIIIPEGWRVGTPEKGWELKLLSPGDCDYKSSWVIYKLHSPLYDYWTSREPECYKDLELETSRAKGLHTEIVPMIAVICSVSIQLVLL